MSIPSVIVELYGVPRLRAGRPELHVSAATVGEALAAVAAVCPALANLQQVDGRLHPTYLLSLDGERFITDLSQRLRPGDRLILLSADAGG